ncbi:MAG: hypothetical protein COC05_00785 [Gammaproteobacteria bacterium]|nr:MAG: hypothetical protein COC05_00785 [Gammaproteobacteria bacterium]
MKKLAISSTGIVAGLALCIFAIPSVNAQTVVKRIDGDVVQTVNYQGKPPFKRQITRLDGTNAAEFARFEEQRGEPVKSLSTNVRRAGPPGKSVPYRGRRVAIQEVAEFARFEESDAPVAARSNRIWRGAPGKSRRLLTD